MAKVCLKCGYERKASDDFPEWGCPKCGAVYATVEAHLIARNQSGEKRHLAKSVTKTENCPICGEKIPAEEIKCTHCGSMLAKADIAAPGNKKNGGLKSGFFSGDLSKKEVVIVIVGLIAVIAVYASLKESSSLEKSSAVINPPLTSMINSNYDFTYKKSANQYGVVFYRFNPVNAPPVELISTSREIKDVNQINRVLTALSRPTVPLRKSYEISGGGLFIWRDYEDGELVVDTRQCKRTDNDNETYSCIDRLYISPSKKQRMVNQANNSKTQAFVTRDEYGKAWPLTVDYGVIQCRRASSVVFMTENNKTYAINGSAMGEKRYDNVREIWKDDPQVSGLKISIEPLIRKGLSLCK